MIKDNNNDHNIEIFITSMKMIHSEKNLLCSCNQLFVFPPQGNLKKCVFWMFSKMSLNCDLYLVHLAGELNNMYFEYFLKCFWIVTFILSIWQASSMAVRAVQVAISDSLRQVRHVAIETIVFWGSCAQLHMWYMEKNTNVQSEPIPTQPTIPFSIALFSVK